MMASARKRKLSVRPAVFAAIFAAGLLGSPTGSMPSRAATTERVVTNFRTGLAISGFDPVAYFTNRAAVLGREEFETRFAGATWRFISSGNRDAFIDHPDAYMPEFGGYDPTGVARGVAVAGHPEVWLIVGERLYLFRDAKARAAFQASSEKFLAAADQRWPALQDTLVR